jgi:hypothetical protein
MVGRLVAHPTRSRCQNRRSRVQNWWTPKIFAANFIQRMGATWQPMSGPRGTSPYAMMSAMFQHSIHPALPHVSSMSPATVPSIVLSM